jgi:hypothetical protein
MPIFYACFAGPETAVAAYEVDRAWVDPAATPKRLFLDGAGTETTGLGAG